VKDLTSQVEKMTASDPELPKKREDLAHAKAQLAKAKKDQAQRELDLLVAQGAIEESLQYRNAKEKRGAALALLNILLRPPPPGYFSLKHKRRFSNPFFEILAGRQTASKRMLESVDSGVSKFLKSEMQHGTRMEQLLPDAPIGQRVLQLFTPLNDVQDSISAVYVRNCYAEFKDRVMQAFATLNGGILVAGTRGTGKSIFGMLMVLELNALGKLVVYDNRPAKLLIVPESGVPRSVHHVFGNKNIDTASVTAGIYDFA